MICIGSEENTLPQLTIIAPLQVNETENFEISLLFNGTPVPISSVEFNNLIIGNSINGIATLSAPQIYPLERVNYTIKAYCGTNSATINITVVRMPEIIISNISSTNISIGEKLTLTIANGDTFQPIKNTSVYVSPFQKTYYTDGNGKIIIDVNTYFIVDTLSIWVQKQGFRTNQSREIKIHYYPLSIIVPLQINETETFKVIILSNGIPAFWAKVKFNGVSNSCDDNGSVFFKAPLITPLNEVTYAINATQPYRGSTITNITIVRIPELVIYNITPTQVRGRENIIVSVVNGDTLEPVDNASVKLEWWISETYQTNNEGKVVITLPDVGQSEYLSFTAAKHGFRPSQKYQIRVDSQYPDPNLFSGYLCMIYIFGIIVTITIIIIIVVKFVGEHYRYKK